MPKEISAKALAVIKKMQQGELTESVIYEKIAAFAKGDENKETLLRLASEEEAHANVWKRYTEADIKPNKWKVFKYTLIARLFGFTFAAKLMEYGEMDAQKEYEYLITSSEPLMADAIEIKQQEEEHEKALLAMLDEERLQYVGSMVLGMNDALVELTGALAGFTFAMQDTKVIALAGLIIGISATPGPGKAL